MGFTIKLLQKRRRTDLVWETFPHRDCNMAVYTPVVHCPSLIRQAADGFKDFLSPLEYRVFVAVLCGAVFGIAGYSDIVRYILFSPSVTAIFDFFSVPSLYVKLNRRHRRRLLKVLPDLYNSPNRYQWAVDDTLVQHFGKTIWGTYNWHDHVSNGYVHGHKLLVVGIMDRKKRVLIPVAWEILHRDLSKETGEKGPEHEKGWEVAVRLLKEQVAFGFPKLTVTTDSWFAGEEFFDALEDAGFLFVVEIKCNRKVARWGRKILGVRVDEFFKGKVKGAVKFLGKRKYAAEAVLRFQDSKRPLKVVAVANHKRLVDEPFAYYVSNKLAWNATKIWGLSRDRWGIEVQFRELKQLFTLGEAAVRSREAVETSISVAAIALTVIRLEQLAEADTNKNQYARPIPAGTIVRDLQIESMLLSISKLASSTETRHRNKFHLRINHRNLNSKPTEVSRNRESIDSGMIRRKSG